MISLISNHRMDFWVPKNQSRALLILTQHVSTRSYSSPGARRPTRPPSPPPSSPLSPALSPPPSPLPLPPFPPPLLPRSKSPLPPTHPSTHSFPLSIAPTPPLHFISCLHLCPSPSKSPPPSIHRDQQNRMYFSSTPPLALSMPHPLSFFCPLSYPTPFCTRHPAPSISTVTSHHTLNPSLPFFQPPSPPRAPL